MAQERDIRSILKAPLDFAKKRYTSVTEYRHRKELDKLQAPSITQFFELFKVLAAKAKETPYIDEAGNSVQVSTNTIQHSLSMGGETSIHHSDGIKVVVKFNLQSVQESDNPSQEYLTLTFYHDNDWVNKDEIRVYIEITKPRKYDHDKVLARLHYATLYKKANMVTPRRSEGFIYHENWPFYPPEHDLQHDNVYTTLESAYQAMMLLVFNREVTLPLSFSRKTK